MPFYLEPQVVEYVFQSGLNQKINDRLSKDPVELINAAWNKEGLIEKRRGYSVLSQTFLTSGSQFFDPTVNSAFANSYSLSLSKSVSSVGDFAYNNIPTNFSWSAGLAVSFWFYMPVTMSAGAAVPSYAVSHVGFDTGSGAALRNWSIGFIKSEGSLSPANQNEIYVALDGNLPTIGPYINEYNAPNGVITTGSWHHVVVSVQKSVDSRCYYDGVELTSSLFSPNAPTPLFNNYAVPFVIGNRTDNAYPSSPILFDEVAIFNTTKNGADAARFYNNGRPINLVAEPGIISYYHFEQSPNDAVGSNNLTLSGTAGYSTNHP